MTTRITKRRGIYTLHKRFRDVGGKNLFISFVVSMGDIVFLFYMTVDLFEQVGNDLVLVTPETSFPYYCLLSFHSYYLPGLTLFLPLLFPIPLLSFIILPPPYSDSFFSIHKTPYLNFSVFRISQTDIQSFAYIPLMNVDTSYLRYRSIVIRSPILGKRQ